MKLSRIILIVVAVVVIAIIAVFAYEVVVAGTSAKKTQSIWFSAAQYPLQLNGNYGVAGQACVNSSSYLYCVGGQDANGGPRSDVYSSGLLSTSSPNITSWASETSSYPANIHGQSCVVSSGEMYCVGGTNDDSGDDVPSSYYASISSSGVVGSWASTTPYPIPIDTQYCVANSGYIYCVGGNNETDGTNADATNTNSVWFAQISASGIGTWNQTSSYPSNVYFPSCYAYAGYVYCLGGADSNNNAVSTDYYAALTANGIGSWIQTTSYPSALSGQACATASGYIYCVGGEGGENSYTSSVYYAPISSQGIGSWKQSANYPLSIGTTCVVASNSYIYCVGGFDSSSEGENGATYFASLSSLSTSSAS